MRRTIATVAVVLSFATFAFSADVTTFDYGTDGWSVSNNGEVIPTGGNPGANMQYVNPETFGISVMNNSTVETLLPGYLAEGGVTLTCDVKVNTIQYWMMDAPRELVVEIIDNTPSSAGLPYVSVWKSIGILNEKPGEPGNNDWMTYAATIDDPNSATLPDGWGGYGDEDPDTYEPILPSDRTFADVLANADEIRFTTYVPGWFFGFTYFDIQVDNVGYVSVPEPASLALLSIGGLALIRRR